MDERRVHIYASGYGFVVVPVCQQAGQVWVECAPARHISLEKALPIVALLSSAIEESAQHACDQLPPWDGERGRWWAHRLYAARLTWQADKLALSILPDGRPGDPKCIESPPESIGEWPANVSLDYVARQLIALLGQALGQASLQDFGAQIEPWAMAPGGLAVPGQVQETLNIRVLASATGEPVIGASVQVLGQQRGGFKRQSRGNRLPPGTRPVETSCRRYGEPL